MGWRARGLDEKHIGPATTKWKTARDKITHLQTQLDRALAKPIRFSLDSAIIPDSANTALNKIADAIKHCPGLPIHIESFITDGLAAKAKGLAQQRADNIKSALQERLQGDFQLESKGWGRDQRQVKGEVTKIFPVVKGLNASFYPGLGRNRTRIWTKFSKR